MKKLSRFAIEQSGPILSRDLDVAINPLNGPKDATFSPVLHPNQRNIIEEVFGMADLTKPQPRVIVFSTPTCSFCNSAKQYFRQKGVSSAMWM